MGRLGDGSEVSSLGRLKRRLRQCHYDCLHGTSLHAWKTDMVYHMTTIMTCNNNKIRQGEGMAERAAWENAIANVYREATTHWALAFGA